jgi:2'-5' RNA ligase
MAFNQASDQAACRWYVALLPPPDIQDFALEVQAIFRDRYDSRAASKSPPHITLQPPFTGPSDAVALSEALATFAATQPPPRIQLDGFGAFPPRVIFIQVQPTPDLVNLQRDLRQHLEQTLGIIYPQDSSRRFTPHITVGFRDLTPSNFQTAWAEFQPQSYVAEFVPTRLTLLQHDGERWYPWADFPLKTADTV